MADDGMGGGDGDSWEVGLEDKMRRLTLPANVGTSSRSSRPSGGGVGGGGGGGGGGERDEGFVRPAPPGSRLQGACQPPGGMSPPFTCVPTSSNTVGGASFSDPQADHAASSVDPVLVEALTAGGKARMDVLKIDVEVARFVKDRTARTYEYDKGTSYHRLIAHKVAAHYGLSSVSVVGAGGTDVARLEKPLPPTGLGIPRMAMPTVRLADIGKPDDVDDVDGAGAGKKTKVMVMKRGGRGGGGGDHDSPRGRVGGHGHGHRGGAGAGPSGGSGKTEETLLEEREAEYERARERIFGGAGRDDSPSSSDGGRTSPAPIHTHGRGEGGGGNRNGGRGRTGGRGRGAGDRGGGDGDEQTSGRHSSPNGGNDGSGRASRRGRQPVAIVRNRMADQLDPDFDRSATRFSGPGPAPSHQPMGYPDGNGYNDYGFRGGGPGYEYGFHEPYRGAGYGGIGQSGGFGYDHKREYRVPGGTNDGGYDGDGHHPYGRIDGPGDFPALLQDFPALGGGAGTKGINERHPPGRPPPQLPPPPPHVPPNIASGGGLGAGLAAGSGGETGFGGELDPQHPSSGVGLPPPGVGGSSSVPGAGPQFGRYQQLGPGFRLPQQQRQYDSRRT